MRKVIEIVEFKAFFHYFSANKYAKPVDLWTEYPKI